MILTFIRVLFLFKTLYQGQIIENEVLPYIAEIIVHTNSCYVDLQYIQTRACHVYII